MYGDFEALGAIPHIANRYQDAILELDPALRIEVEASIRTLFLTGGTITTWEDAVFFFPGSLY